jgi:glycosidase
MPRYPSLYQINTRTHLDALSRTLGRPATLDDIPDRELDWIETMGFDWVWLLGVWQTGEASRTVSRTRPDLLEEFNRTLPDLQEVDICGSCFAITGYTVHRGMGGNEALQRLHQRIHSRGMRLLLDFVPNHTALDHPWVKQHPEYYVAGTEADLLTQPQNYARLKSKPRSGILAYGRDPYFPGWTDTYQLDYSNPKLQEAMQAELLQVASLCDGVRCDMAMLILPEIFERTWGRRPADFWPGAIESVRQEYPEFLFMAEVYWDLEWTLQQQGFDYCYDKRLYDRLREGNARPMREHFRAGLDYQDKLARFLENHDEPRAAATFPLKVHEAAAVITFFTPGLRFFHQGQLTGYEKRLPVHLCRGPHEPDNPQLKTFYDRILAALKQPAVRDGEWSLLECLPAWEGNWTWDCFVAFTWQTSDGQRLLCVVNYAPNASQAYLRLPFTELPGRAVELRDLLSPAVYERNGDLLYLAGLYLDLPPWGYHLFELKLGG